MKFFSTISFFDEIKLSKSLLFTNNFSFFSYSFMLDHCTNEYISYFHKYLNNYKPIQCTTFYLNNDQIAFQTDISAEDMSFLKSGKMDDS